MLPKSNLLQSVFSVAGRFFNTNLNWVTANHFKTSILKGLLNFATFMKQIQSLLIRFYLELKCTPYYNRDTSEKLLQHLPAGLDRLLTFNWFE